MQSVRNVLDSYDIKLKNKEKLYKDVPLQTWFDFKFNVALDSFYISHIKYNYIPI